jgi:AraC-like DNA-binding protein
MLLRRGAAKDDRLHHLIEFALSELRDRSAGRHSMLLRLAELMFAEVVRRHLDFLPEAQAGWLAGLKDALVARALSLLHGDPARQWTLQALAEESGASRSVLAERFAYLVGQPPMQYLSQWRLQLAARLLDQPGSKVVAVAAAVGYQSEAAFSRAFRRSTAVPPSRWRHRGQDQVDSTGPTVLRSPNG